MSLQPQALKAVPRQTARVARAAEAELRAIGFGLPPSYDPVSARDLGAFDLPPLSSTF